MSESQITDEARRLLTPAALARLKALKLRAKAVVDGVVNGLHRSPHHGSSVEFAEHNEYAPGDEIRHIDWRVYGKSDKYYVKRFEQETNLQAMLLVDNSASMLYQSPDSDRSKWMYAQELAASLSFLMIQQQDAVGLVVSDSEVQTYLPPRSRSSHHMNLCEELVRCEPKKGAGTSLSTGIIKLSDVFSRKGLVVIISDFMDFDPQYFQILRRLKGRRQRVRLFHVMDPWELEFPFNDMTMFRPMEGGKPVLAEPRVMREAYLRCVRDFVNNLRSKCLEHSMEYHLMNTADDLVTQLTSVLAGTVRPPFESADGV